MNGKQLKNSILQWAIQGKLVPQDPNDEPASVLLDKIRQEKERLIKEKKIKRDKNASIIYRGEDNSYYEKITATGEVKCIDEEIPFEIPSSWSWARLLNVSIYIQRGKSPKYSPIKKYPVIAQKCNQWAGFSIDKALFIEPESLSKYAIERILQDEDLMWNSTGLGTLGRMAVYYAKLNPYELAVADSHVTVIRLFKPFMSPLFFYFYFANPTVQSVIEDKSDGSTKQKELSTTTICNYLVPIPPRNEQKRIISKVTSLLPVIEKYGTQQEKLDKLNRTINEQIKKSVLQEAIQGKLVPQIASEGTAQELLEQIKEEKLKLVKEGKVKKFALNDSVIFRGDDNKYYELIDNSPVCIDEFLPFQIPETWTWCKVKDLSEIQTGASFKKEQANANKKGIRILRGGNILPNKYIFKNDDVFVSEEFVSANTILKKNCIITPAVTSLENIGKMAVIEKDYNNVSAGGFVFIISPYIQAFNHSLLLAYFLQSPFLIEAMRGITKKSGAAFYNLGKERLKELYLPLPPMAEQSRIVGKINEILSSIMSR